MRSPFPDSAPTPRCLCRTDPCLAAREHIQDQIVQLAKARAIGARAEVDPDPLPQKAAGPTWVENRRPTEATL
jgi:hypothetical protein